MKIGCISWSHRNDFANGTLDLPKWMEHCKKKAGLEGVELWNNHFESIEEGYLAKLLAKSIALELPIYSVATKCKFGDFSEASIADAKKTLRDWLKVADTLRAPLLRVSVAGDDLRSEAHQKAVFCALADVVNEKTYPNIRVGIENQEPGVVQNPADVRRMVEESKGALCVILDNGSFINKQDSYAFMKAALPYAGVVHAKFFDLAEDGSDKVLDYKRVRDLLKEAGYDDWLSIEYDSQAPALTDVPRIAAFLRKLF